MKNSKIKTQDLESNILQCSYNYDNVLSVLVSECNGDEATPSKYVKVFHINCPPADSLLFETISSILAFATAVNYKYKAHSIYTPFKVPIIFDEIVNEYNQLQNYNHVTFKNVSESRQTLNRKSSDRIGILYSGGKDSFYKLTELLNNYDKRDIIGIYIRGGMINSEFPAEFSRTESLFLKLGIELKVIDVWHGDYRSPPIKMGLRAIWRDMLLLSTGKIFSDTIATGINQDDIFKTPLFQARKEICSEIYLLFSETKLVVDKLSELLNATISGVPSELSVYGDLKMKHPEMVSETHSCFDPSGSCSPNQKCNKCFSLYVYNKFINDEEFTPEEISRILSPLWIGSAELIQYVHTLKPNLRTVGIEKTKDGN